MGSNGNRLAFGSLTNMQRDCVIPLKNVRRQTNGKSKRSKEVKVIALATRDIIVQRAAA